MRRPLVVASDGVCVSIYYDVEEIHLGEALRHVESADKDEVFL